MNDLSENLRSIIKIIDFRKIKILNNNNIDFILNEFRSYFQDELSKNEINYLREKYHR